MTENIERSACPLCGDEFEIGHTADIGRSRIPIWIEGEPEISLAGLKTKGKRMFHLDALRCTQCGFVAQVAHRNWTPGKK
jgi:hypothetical protein